MKFFEPLPFADPDAAARKLVEIANGIEAVQEAQALLGSQDSVWAAQDINRAQQDSCDHDAADCVESANRHLLTLSLSHLGLLEFTSLEGLPWASFEQKSQVI